MPFALMKSLLDLCSDAPRHRSRVRSVAVSSLLLSLACSGESDPAADGSGDGGSGAGRAGAASSGSGSGGPQQGPGTGPAPDVEPGPTKSSTGSGTNGNGLTAPGAAPEDPLPALSPKLLVLTFVGGAGDQWINEVGFAEDGSIYGRGSSWDEDGNVIGSYGVTYDAQATSGVTDGNLHLSQPSGFDYWSRSVDYLQPNFKIDKNHDGRRIEDPITGLSLRAGWFQPASDLQQPFVIAEKDGAEQWKLWDWSAEDAFAANCRADTRMYDAWWVPGGSYLGVQLRTDGGGSTADREPRDLSAPAQHLQGSWTQQAGGTATQYALIDTVAAKIVSGTWISGTPTRVAFDAWGRAYLPIVQPRYKDMSIVDAFGLGFDPKNADTGLFVLDQTWKHPELHTFLGGDVTTCATTNDEDPLQRIGVLAIKDNLLVMGGVTCVPSMATTPNAVQASSGGGLDGMFAVVQLW